MEEEEYYEFSIEELQGIRAGIKEEVFEIKQFIAGKAPIFKLFSSRIKRIDELSEIQQDLFPDDVVQPGDKVEVQPYVGSTLTTIFNTYFSNKNILKQRAFATKSLVELSSLMLSMCENERTFAKVFVIPEMTEGKIVSKELDPMDIMNSIKEANEIGIITIENIRERSNELPYILNGEIKRLLLLSRNF